MKIEPNRLREVFAKAFEFKSADERENYLATACKDQPELRQEVESLILAHGQAGDFLAQTMTMPPPDILMERTGTRIGRYKLLEKIGEGGFGVVFMAEQQEPVQRNVALKIIKAGMDTKEVIARFEAEQQALALMDHPNIARVLDAGATESGRPFFVMELVRGIPITDYCDQNNLPTAGRLQLFIKVCQAVQHAHQKAVIHRDLKPSNILVTLHDGDPMPKVIDFGVAKALGQKLTEKTLFTSFAQMIGTPAYMSPEQAELSALDIDTRSDIYSLGVLLYELLTGVTPFDKERLAKAALDEIRRMIRETEPLKPSTRLRTLGEKIHEVARRRHTEPVALGRFVRGDLDWIVMKCLEKDRKRRYETANGVALDVKRFLNTEPVSAAAPGTVYRARKFVERHRVGFAMASAIAALVAAGVAVSTVEAVKASHNAAVAERNAARAAKFAEESEVNLYSADIRLAQQALEEGNLGRARTLLEGHLPLAAQRDQRGFEWYYLWRLCQGDNIATFRGHSNIVTSVAFSPDGKILASGSRDCTVKLWEIETGKCLTTFATKSHVNCVAFSADGSHLAAGCVEGVLVWSLLTREVVFGSQDRDSRVAFSPLGNLLAIGSGGGLFGGSGSSRIAEWPGGREIVTLPDSGGRVAFSANGRWLVTGDWNGLIKLWEVGTWRLTSSITGTGSVSALSLSPDGQIVGGVNEWSGAVTLWETLTGRRKSKLEGHSGRVWGTAFGPDGTTFATASSDQTIGLWDIGLGTLHYKLRGHGSEAWAVAFSPNGKAIATGSKDETVMLWNTIQPRQIQTLQGVFARPVFSSDSRIMALRSGERDVTLWDVPSGSQRALIRGGDIPMGFSLDGTALMTAAFSNTPSRGTLNKLLAIRVWDLEAGFNRAAIQLEAPMDVISVTLSPDRTILAGSNGHEDIILWDAVTGRVLKSVHGSLGTARELAFAPDGRMLAFAGDEVASLCEVQTGKARATLRGHKDGIFAVIFSPDGNVVATASTDNTIRLWSVETGKEIGKLLGHKEGVIDVAFSPDGRTLASGSGDHFVKLWSVATHRELAVLRLDSPVSYIAFSPDGLALATCCDPRTAYLWRASNEHSAGGRKY